MTPSSNQPTTRRAWTPAERKRAVKAYHARGDRTVADVAAEIGVNIPLLYHWIKRAAEGTLDDMPGGKTSTSTAITVAKPKSAAITRRRAEPAPAPQSLLTATFAPSSKLGESEREELARLRVEVRRLRRAIVVAYELNPGDDYRH